MNTTIKNWNNKMDTLLDGVPLLGKVNRWCDKHRAATVTYSLLIGAAIGAVLYCARTVAK